MWKTSLVRSPHHYGHLFSAPNCIPPCKLAACLEYGHLSIKVTFAQPHGPGERNSEVPLFKNIYNSYYIAQRSHDPA